MPPRLNLFTSSRTLLRSSTSTSTNASSTSTSSRLARLNLNSRQQLLTQRAGARATYSTSSGTTGQDGVEVDQDGKAVDPSKTQLPDVGQEAAEIDRIVNKGGGGEGGGSGIGSCGKEVGSPEFEQGTPVQEVSFYCSFCCIFWGVVM
jgi:hypothetical protein